MLLNQLAVLENHLLSPRIARSVFVETQMSKNVEHQGLPTGQADSAVRHAVVQLDHTLMRLGQLWVGREHKFDMSMPVVVAPRTMPRLVRRLDLKHAGNHEVSKLVARVAVRPDVPPEPVESEGMRRQSPRRLLRPLE